MPRAHVAVHRVGRRIQPGPRGPRQRGDERDHARADAQAGARPLRAGDRVRGTRGVSGSQAQELLLGHARAAGILGGDPGGRRHPVDRRGARGRGRRVPAEVLRGLQPAARRGANHRVRHPRHGFRQSLLPPCAACSSVATSSRSASLKRWPTTTWRSTSIERELPLRPMSTSSWRREWEGSHEARILEAWTEDASGKRQNACPQGERLRFKAAVAFESPLDDPPFSVEIEDEWGTKMFVATTLAENERSGHFAAGEAGGLLRRVREPPVSRQVLPDRERLAAWRRSRRDPSRAANVDDCRVRLDRPGRCRGPPVCSHGSSAPLASASRRADSAAASGGLRQGPPDRVSRGWRSA